MNKPVFYILLGLWLCFGLRLTGQENLVPNGSFEEYSECPVELGEIEKLNSWFSPTSTTPDYFNSCSLGVSAGIPLNTYGYRHAQDGNAYCGIVNNTIDEFREYIAVELNSVLESNTLYSFNMFVSVSNAFYNPSNNLSVIFLEDLDDLIIDESLSSGTPILTNVPSLIFPGILDDSINWVELTKDYYALGCEKYMVIGNFSKPYTTQFQISDSLVESYFFIDNISLTKSGNYINHVPNVFSPNDDGINDVLFSEIPFVELFEVLNRWGQVVFTQQGEIFWDGLINGEIASEGVYFYRYETKGCSNKKLIKTGFFHLVR